MQAFAEKNSFFAILHPSCASIALCTSRVLLREPYPPQPAKAARRLPFVVGAFSRDSRTHLVRILNVSVG